MRMKRTRGWMKKMLACCWNAVSRSSTIVIAELSTKWASFVVVTLVYTLPRQILAYIKWMLTFCSMRSPQWQIEVLRSPALTLQKLTGMLLLTSGKSTSQKCNDGFQVLPWVVFIYSAEVTTSLEIEDNLENQTESLRHNVLLHACTLFHLDRIFAISHIL